MDVFGPDQQKDADGCTQVSCGSSKDHVDALPDSIRDRIKDHPCYSEEAHHHYARMHVAVAPACNIQCNYCNRKYDCANESRPGVVSEVLTPEQAIRKTLAVAASIPQMTVLGVAGPGDPLANPARTFETFRQLSQKAPDIKLCVSTNGLALPDCVEELAQYNVDHVTITINAVHPEIGAQIYPWIFWKNRRMRGVKAAKILLERQLLGLEMLIEKGILVKVNSVMIPGVNDAHLEEVSKVIRAKGAFLHNVMPLIAEAEHGTYYGVMGQRGPTQAELTTLQDACGDMNMMRHCRQCRADAVGLLGEDRGEDFTLAKIDGLEIDYQAAMKERAEVHAQIEADRARKKERAADLKAQLQLESGSTRTLFTYNGLSVGQTGKTLSGLPADLRPVQMAVASKGQGLINQHFGHAKEFMIYEASPAGARLVGHRKTAQYCSGDTSCGDGETTLQKTIRMLSDCEAVLCSKIGFEPWDQLEAAGIAPNGEHAMEPIAGAVMAVYRELYESGALDAAATTRPISA
ncbi:nitrogenase cofactor biosynthesis protein NifB [Cohaesibacter sp. CAU 1516]|uniref:nitrogenase cofactor biosynthesis protein NifB n=1 Tax=Cohaesibacter sp. CAU 1516 TaxID=2576038 RepID=UPI0010FD7F1C|nr:nitrogenase cofactor biosynthesis protein NifB [Cohaesibacter sp. CAU 1516]TLP44265.1 nitrogenase cofactor biosynthesis protein NifB [Cohaesibacter sp. CAU 1516]